MPKVEFNPEARADLFGIHDYILARGGGARASRYVDRIERRCLILADWPHAGAARDDIQPGIRLLTFDLRVAILYHLSTDRVVVDRVLHAGRQP